jgi:hypothetical protein
VPPHVTVQIQLDKLIALKFALREFGHVKVEANSQIEKGSFELAIKFVNLQVSSVDESAGDGKS